ncbi:hypothetical protein [Crateriforma conspicua]|uniref:NHL repeat protein n=1 Tax=Crateriforma conspicua TaxID=2527996 RepID=A0A5C6FY87_9PLAN|nr:hypothetical protein [Crateriforma conspicua]TWU67346.1 NHL repeat protein [Crateriforma conspicua]
MSHRIVVRTTPDWFRRPHPISFALAVLMLLSVDVPAVWSQTVTATVPVGMPFGVEVDGDDVWVTSITDESVGLISPDDRYRPLIGGAEAGVFQWPHEVRVGDAQQLYIADTRNHRIIRVDTDGGSAEQADPADHRYQVIAGTGKAGFADGPGGSALFNQPHSVVVLDAKTLLIADTKNHRIRKLDLKSGVVSPFCGDGSPELPKDGQARQQASLFGPRSLAVDDTSIWIALREGNSIWRLDRATDTLHHIAGNGQKGYDGDGGSAKAATMNGPKGLDIDAEGGVLVVDTENHCVRRVDVAADRIETVLGGNQAAKTTELKRPHGIAATGQGRSFWLADSENDRMLLFEDQ